MTRKYVYSILLAILFLPYLLYSQTYKNKSFTCFNYKMDISKELADEIKTIKDEITIDTGQNDKFEYLLVHNCYEIFKQRLNNEAEIFILPVNSYGDDVKYNNFGYPITNIQRAINYGESMYYIKLIINWKTKDYKERQKSNPGTTQPIVTITLHIYNKYGYVAIDKFTSTIEYSHSVEINKELLQGFINQDEDTEASLSLYSIFNKALDEIITQIME